MRNYDWRLREYKSSLFRMNSLPKPHKYKCKCSVSPAKLLKELRWVPRLPYVASASEQLLTLGCTRFWAAFSRGFSWRLALGGAGTFRWWSEKGHHRNLTHTGHSAFGGRGTSELGGRLWGEEGSCSQGPTPKNRVQTHKENQTYQSEGVNN